MFQIKSENGKELHKRKQTCSDKSTVAPPRCKKTIVYENKNWNFFRRKIERLKEIFVFSRNGVFLKWFYMLYSFSFFPIIVDISLSFSFEICLSVPSPSRPFLDRSNFSLYLSFHPFISFFSILASTLSSSLT